MILVVGALSLATNQLNLGIDFESGTRLNFSPQQSATVEEVREVLDEHELGDAEVQETEDEQFGAGSRSRRASCNRPGSGRCAAT